jgi:hypothetical protein
MTVTWIMPARGGHATRSGTTIRDGIYGTIQSAGSSNGQKNRPQINFSIRVDVMQAMRWVAGDRVLVGFDAEQKTIAMRRDKRGHKLVANGKAGLNVEGKCVQVNVKISMRDSIPEDVFPFHVALADCVIDGVDIHFQPAGIAAAEKGDAA